MPDLALIEQLDQDIDVMLAGAAQPRPADLTLAGLMDVAGTLRSLPDERFKARLGAELQKRVPMTASTTASSAVIHAIMPSIAVPEGAKLIDFLKHTFGAEEIGRHSHGPGHGFVATVKIGDSDLLIMGGESIRGHERTTFLHVYVKDCDATYRLALDAGAVTISPGFGEPADRPYGERAAFVADPFGNHWNIAARFDPSSKDPMFEDRKQVTIALYQPNASALIDFLKRAFGAEEVGNRHEAGGHLAHAFVRIGKVVIEMGDIAETELRRSYGFYMYTDDVDAVYHRAVAAGAVSLSPPADQAYGDRIAVLQDPFGNNWIPAKTSRT
jgi:PhnB protein